MTMNPEDMERIVDDLDAEFKRLCGNPAELKVASGKLLEYMIDELTLELIFETHRAVKVGLRETVDEAYNEEEFIVSSSTDNEKQQAVKKAQDCTCPICNRVVFASRFAPHLEKCMGMGRKRSRNASRMVTNNNNKERETSYGGLASDDEDDADWNSGDKRKRKKNNSRMKKSKNSPKKNGEYATSDIPYMNYENMSEEEKKTLLMKYCGVVSEHTKKICSRSLRCALHSDEKRRALRTAVICDTEQTELVNVDIEGDDDVDSNLRELLQDNSNTSSPADSASNSNSSTSSKKRDKSSKNSKNKKKERSSPTTLAPAD